MMIDDIKCSLKTSDIFQQKPHNIIFETLKVKEVDVTGPERLLETDVLPE